MPVSIYYDFKKNNRPKRGEGEYTLARNASEYNYMYSELRKAIGDVHVDSGAVRIVGHGVALACWCPKVLCRQKSILNLGQHTQMYGSVDSYR